MILLPAPYTFFKKRESQKEGMMTQIIRTQDNKREEKGGKRDHRGRRDREVSDDGTNRLKFTRYISLLHFGHHPGETKTALQQREGVRLQHPPHCGRGGKSSRLFIRR
jgi:hypothetical protein